MYWRSRKDLNLRRIIQTLASLAGRWFQPLTHYSISAEVVVLRVAML